ncbi:M16 family metallopeptidase [Phenylobacterium montanum]|uniref:Insulinase family protein n=1 Tax=Phenylobacterium montanum TaxID=2823693 RepID=A0A975G3K8_9CAUL|nr:insulinase family protein [Caulobacter sp. S6]QUD89877.1 insulinase family protein [Caulobacter sp. S6]
MIRPSRAALLASCALALSACGTFHHKPPPAQANASAGAERPAGSHHLFAKRGAKGAVPAAKALRGAAPDNVWAQTYAGLPPDPDMRFGTLPNGLRYVVMKNATPGGQSSLRLRIGAGSLEENDQQQGLAHLLEHMAFNGSTHVPAGEMIKILERHGLAFGADTNAYTSQEETVYKLDLPKSDADTVDTSLMLLREIGGELTLDQGVMDNEKGVVLSEERLRDTPGYRLLKESFGQTLKGQLVADRFPIGKVEAIKAATHNLLADYYRRWYRPENAVVVAVGDFDADAMEAQIKAKFGDWRGVGPAGTRPNLGAPEKRGPETKLVALPGATPLVQLAWTAPVDPSLDSAARRRRDLVDSLGLAVLNRRLDRLVRSENPPFVGAGAERSELYHSAKVTSIRAAARPGEWKAALDSMVAEQRRLVKFGVSQSELAAEIDGQRAVLKASAEGAKTRTTPSIADDIVATLNSPEVETSPAEDLALFEAAVKTITPAEVSAAMAKAFGGDGPLVLTSVTEAKDGDQKELADALTAAEKGPVSAPVLQADLTWPYYSFGPVGEVAEQTEVADLDTVFVRFKNGVRLTVKPTKFRTDQILVQARIGHGLLDLPSDRTTPAWAAASAFPEGGLGKLTAEDVDQALRSRIVGRNFAISDSAFVEAGATRPEDLDVQLQLLAAHVADPGWRPEAFQRMKSAAPTILDQLSATPAGVLNRDLGGLLHGGDKRWGFPDAAAISAETPKELHDLLAQPLSSGPIEIVVVGDITVDKAIAAVASTFGALPQRADLTAPNPAPVSFPAADAKPLVRTHKGRADQAIGFIAWPTDDFLSDTQRARTLSILGEVMQLRVTDQLRRAEGATYSPSAGSSVSDVFPHYGYLSVRVEIPPAKLDGFFKDVDAIAADLRTKPVSADELDRAKGPAVESLLKRRQTNEYWLTALAGAQSDPRKLAAIRTSEAQLSRVSAADVQAAAQTYLLDGKAWKMEVKPAGAM